GGGAGRHGPGGGGRRAGPAWGRRWRGERVRGDGRGGRRADARRHGVVDLRRGPTHRATGGCPDRGPRSPVPGRDRRSSRDPALPTPRGGVLPPGRGDRGHARGGTVRRHLRARGRGGTHRVVRRPDRPRPAGHAAVGTPGARARQGPGAHGRHGAVHPGFADARRRRRLAGRMGPRPGRACRDRVRGHAGSTDVDAAGRDRHGPRTGWAPAQRRDERTVDRVRDRVDGAGPGRRSVPPGARRVPLRWRGRPAGRRTVGYRARVLPGARAARRREPGADPGTRTSTPAMEGALMTRDPLARIVAERGERALEELSVLRSSDPPTTGGRVLSYVYDSGVEGLDELAVRASALAYGVNGLDPTVFGSVAALHGGIVRRMRAVLAPPDDDEVFGSVTSGGTESCLLACLAAREVRARTAGDGCSIVAPVTVHAAFRKAAHVLGIRFVGVEVDPATARVSADDMLAAVDSDTCLVVCSAPSYPTGVIDPVVDVAAGLESLDRSIGLHVDA